MIVVVAASALVAQSSRKYLNKGFATYRHHFSAPFFSNQKILQLTNKPIAKGKAHIMLIEPRGVKKLAILKMSLQPKMIFGFS